MQLLDRGFSFPLHDSKKFAIDHPEILLTAAVVVATKLTLPFNGQSPLLTLDDALGCTTFHWDNWFNTVAQPLIEKKEARTVPDYTQMKADQVVSLSQPELNAYFAHTAGLIDANSESHHC